MVVGKVDTRRDASNKLVRRAYWMDKCGSVDQRQIFGTNHLGERTSDGERPPPRSLTQTEISRLIANNPELAGIRAGGAADFGTHEQY